MFQKKTVVMATSDEILVCVYENEDVAVALLTVRNTVSRSSSSCHTSSDFIFTHWNHYKSIILAPDRIQNPQFGLDTQTGFQANHTFVYHKIVI